MSAAPNARQIGVINRFLMLGDLDQGSGAVPYAVQWSSINEPTDWPTPGTSTARARQASEQFLQAEQGAVTAIAGGLVSLAGVAHAGSITITGSLPAISAKSPASRFAGLSWLFIRASEYAKTCRRAMCMALIPVS